jgi:hypothetical protein
MARESVLQGNTMANILWTNALVSEACKNPAKEPFALLPERVGGVRQWYGRVRCWTFLARDTCVMVAAMVEGAGR